jgi:hypothetical protein
MSGESVPAKALIIRASSSSPKSAPIEQQPRIETSSGSGRIPRQPRPQMQVQFDSRNERSKRQTVGPDVISTA